MTGRYHYQTLWEDAPPGAWGGDNTEVVLGTRIRFHADGAIIGAKYYMDNGNHGRCLAMLLDGWHPGTVLRSALFHEPTADDVPGHNSWQSIYFARQFKVTDGDEWVIAVHFPEGDYWRQASGLSGAPVIVEDLEAVQDGDGGSNGIYTLGNGWDLNLTFGSGFYGIDVIFRTDAELHGG